MKEQMINALKRAKDDADYFVYVFAENGINFTTKRMDKAAILELLEKCPEVVKSEETSDCWMVTDKIGVGLKDFDDNIFYETPDTKGFVEHVSKYNKYHNVFIRLDKENKTIEFKLGDKYKKLELMENQDYVSRPYRQKYLKVVSAEGLEKFINDDFWNPRMITLGRKVLKIGLVKPKTA